VKADIEDGYRVVNVNLPAVFTVTREVNTPRKLSFSGIIKARQKEITTWGVEDLGLSEDEVGLKGSPTLVSKMERIEVGRQAKWIKGDLSEKAEQLIQILKNAGVQL
jgi:electron transfer flavoprotein beta subunit